MLLLWSRSPTWASSQSEFLHCTLEGDWSEFAQKVLDTIGRIVGLIDKSRQIPQPVSEQPTDRQIDRLASRQIVRRATGATFLDMIRLPHTFVASVRRLTGWSRSLNVSARA